VLVLDHERHMHISACHLHTVANISHTANLNSVFHGNLRMYNQNDHLFIRKRETKRYIL